MRRIVILAVCLAVMPLFVGNGAQAGTIVVGNFGDYGWYSDDTRTAAGVDLVGLNSTHYGKPGQTPTAADDVAIGQQLDFVSGPAGATGAGALKIDGTTGNPGKSTISVIDTATGFADAGDLVDGSFSATYRWYMEPVPTVRTLAFRLGIQSTEWANSQTSFTAARSGESAWDLILVNLMATPVANDWNTVSVTKDDGVWALYAQAGNAYWSPAAPGGATQQTLQAWADDATWGAFLFGNGAVVSAMEFGLGSYQRNNNAYLDYLQTNIYNGGDMVDFGVVPEPISMVFFGTGLVAVGGFVARRKLRKA